MDRLYNLRKLAEIAQGDESFIREMLITFVENVTSEIKGIQSFKTAENWSAIAESAHKLASNFAYLGADRLHALAADIEKSVVNDSNFAGIADKTDRLCSGGVLLANQLKKDFSMTGSD
jgi:HPt (histidine-containing phosphotransfer) domain-containing protein